MTQAIKIGSYTFDNVDYDAGGDVLYLHKGDPSTAVDFDETPEGHALRFNSEGELVGITIVRPRMLLERHGSIAITLPQRVDVNAPTLGTILAAA